MSTITTNVDHVLHVDMIIVHVEQMSVISMSFDLIDKSIYHGVQKFAR